MTWGGYAAVLLDLDGVLTPTAEVHMRAWSAMFNEFLADHDGPGDTSPYTDVDYFAILPRLREEGSRFEYLARRVPSTLATKVVDEAVSRYLGWQNYHHEAVPSFAPPYPFLR